MQAQYAFLMENETLELTALPDHPQVITCRCCSMLNRDWDGHILNYKARWVTHSFKQKEGIDFVETFAVVIKHMSYKCLFGVSMKPKYKNWQIDVVTASYIDFKMNQYMLKNLTFFNSIQTLYVACIRLYMD